MTNHPNRGRNSAVLRGHRRTDSGQMVPGHLALRRDAGGWYDPDMDCPGMQVLYVAAREYQITGTLVGVEIVSVGGGEFLPDAGECERIGLTVVPLS